MRVSEEFYQQYRQVDKVKPAIDKLVVLVKDPDVREYAKRMRAWITMCYKMDEDGTVKSKGGICADWLEQPLRAIEFMKSIADGPGKFERISPIKDFGPTNIRYRRYGSVTPVPEESGSLGA